MAMKDYSTDARWSPAAAIAKYLKENHDGELVVWDNNVDREHVGVELNYIESIDEAVKDASIVITGARQDPLLPGNQNDVELLAVMQDKSLLIDTRFLFEKTKVESRGIEYKAL
ncbi:MAG: UDP binding domain-containing protein [Caldisericia bacterium]